MASRPLHGLVATLFVVSLSILASLTSVFPMFLTSYWSPAVDNRRDFSPATPHGYQFQMISTDPVMAYLEHFIQPSEVENLLQLGEAHYTKSRIYSEGSETPDAYRTSDSCVLPNNDTTVIKIRERVSSLLGFLPYDGVEALQLVRYRPSQLFALHHDWFAEPKLDPHGRRYNRLASIFVYLDAGCVSGATYFPNLPPPPAARTDDARFSTTAEGKGLGILPVVGNGVFWMNLKKDYSGDERLLHAGLPVAEGTKVGMNIWITKFVE